MPKKMNMTEYRVPGLEGEDDQITFEASTLLPTRSASPG